MFWFFFLVVCFVFFFFFLVFFYLFLFVCLGLLLFYFILFYYFLLFYFFVLWGCLLFLILLWFMCVFLKMQFSVYFRMLSLLDTYTAEVSSHVSFSTENINIAAVDVSRDDAKDVDFTPRLADGNLTVDVSVRHVTSFC